jgi:hypothetical protein
MSVHIEATDWTFEKGRHFVIGDLQDALRIYSRIQQELLFRGRRVLVLATSDIPSSKKIILFQESWDFILHIRNNTDYSLLAAYVQASPKPITILWLGSEVPQVLLQKFDLGVHWICSSGSVPVARGVFNTFISPEVPVFKYKEWFLAHSGGSHAILESVDDFRLKNAGLLVCPDQSVKWYDSASLDTARKDISVKEIREILKWCVDSLDDS